MTFAELMKKVPLKVFVDYDPDREIETVYIGDLLSFVMANGKEDALWLTVQRHINVIAVAQLNDFAGIVFVEGVEPDEDALLQAREHEIPLLGTSEDAYSLCKLLIEAGL